MARTSIKLYASGFAQVDSDNPSTVVPAVTNGPNKLGSWGTDREYGVRLLFKIQDARATLGNKRLYEAQARFATAQPNSGLIYPLKTTYNASTVTWNTKPQMFTEADGVEFLVGGSRNNTKTDATFVQSIVSTESLSKTAQAYVQSCTGTMLASSSLYALWAYTTLVDTTAPYIEIFYDDSINVESQIVYRSGPASGYKNPRNAISFSWDYEKSDDYYCAAAFVQASAVLHWKKSTDANYTSINISGSTKSVTVAANTFPAASTIQWYISGTDTAGTTSQTSVYSFSTAAGTAYATAQSPISSVEDGSAPITFNWTLSSTDGQTPSGVDLWWKLPSEAQNEWHVLLGNASPRTSYTVSAGTFSAGEIQWIVRAYNIDGTAGPWSMQATGFCSFICVIAPEPLAGLNATAVPRTTISWQSAEQQAYEITIDGEVVQRAFGTDVYSWTVQEPLEEGQHTISVRVQGQYGLWSQPSTVIITVGGPTVLPTAMTISGEFDVDAILNTETPAELSYIISGTSNSINATTGNTTTSSVFNYTDYIDISAFSKILYKRTKHTTSSTTVGMAFYNSSKVYISGIRGEARQTETGYAPELYETEVPEGAVYARFSVYADVQTQGEFLVIGIGSLEVRYYRDGQYIGTSQGSGLFTDSRVLGTHSYFSRVFLSGGNYQQSNTVTGTMSSRFLQVLPLDGSSGWLALRLSENSADEHDFQWSRTQIVQHVTGARYPQAELSQFEDLNASYTCAFRNRSEALAFEALRGKAVILKSRGDNVVIGILNQISKRQTVFYTAYAFTVTQIHTDEYTEVL